MADPKKRRRTKGTGDTFRGRRGGGWLPDGYDPTEQRGKPVAEKREPTKAELEREAELKRQVAEMRAYERVSDLVPGSAGHDGTKPTGGVSWEGAARMAAARKAADVPLPDRDFEALERHPRPRSCFGDWPFGAAA